MDNSHEWWQSGVIYQIYPRSFQDSNGDGIGDLPGICSRLDYLRWLGVDAIWLSPIYPSPMADFGYDISDYTEIDPIFGTLADFDRLIEAAHYRNLKVLLDFVPNHTSDQHPWFRESRSARSNPKRDWYLWRSPPPGGGPPNNWLSNFGGSAWEFDPITEQYFYHAFLKEQPDLNWRNLQVQDAMFDVLRFWMDRGVDGFRIDVIWHIVKDEEFRNNPSNPAYQPGQNPFHALLATYSEDQPEVHDIIAKMRQTINSYPGRMMVGEIYLPVERLVTYYGAGGSDGVHLPFNFQLTQLPWNARTVDSAVQAYEAALPSNGWPNWVLGNHDKPRLASRIGLAQTRVAAMLLLTLRGTPTMYYGDELGLQDVSISSLQVQDPLEKNVPGLGLGRDPARTPMQWNENVNAGFSDASPWLPLAEDCRYRNVDVQRAEPASILNLYQELLTVRRREPSLNIGDYAPVTTSGNLLAYRRFLDGRAFLIVLNFGAEPQQFVTDENFKGTIKVSTVGRNGEVASSFNMLPNEGVIIEVH